MRFLIITAAVLACVAASPINPLAYSAPIAPALLPARPTISAGDITGAAIDAQVEVEDHLQAAVDTERQLADKASELQGQALNDAEENAWRAADSASTLEAVLDGAAARDAPVIAKNIARSTIVPVASNIIPKTIRAVPYTAPISYVPKPVVYSASPIAYSASPVRYVSSPFTLRAPYRSIYSPIQFTQHLAYDHIW